MLNTINELIPRNKQKELENSFGYASGFGVIFVDAHGSHIGKGGNFCKFCTLINSSTEGKNKCRQCNEQAIVNSTLSNEPVIYVCHAGLINIAIPLYLNNRLLGALTAGQVRCNPHSKYFEDVSQNWPKDLDYKKLKNYFDEIPILSDKEIESTVTALANITDYIIQLNANRIYSEQLSQQKDTLYKIEREKLILESKLNRIKYSTLQKQIMPHFIFNVLNSAIRLIALNRTLQAIDMLYNFSDMLRYVFSYKDNSTTLRKELKCIQDYIDIQKIRFNGKFDYIFNINEDALDTIIPYFSLQPLIENIFHHGFKNIERLGKLKLFAESENNICHINISDNGIGMERAKIRKIYDNFSNPKDFNKNVGIFNVYSRFSLMFPNSLKFNIDSAKDKGTSIKISFDSNDLTIL